MNSFPCIPIAVKLLLMFGNNSCISFCIESFFSNWYHSRRKSTVMLHYIWRIALENIRMYRFLMRIYFIIDVVVVVVVLVVAVAVVLQKYLQYYLFFPVIRPAGALVWDVMRLSSTLLQTHLWNILAHHAHTTRLNLWPTRYSLVLLCPSNGMEMENEWKNSKINTKWDVTSWMVVSFLLLDINKSVSAHHI